MAIMKLAPIGTFGAMAFTIGAYGIGSLGPLLKLLEPFILPVCCLLCWLSGRLANMPELIFYTISPILRKNCWLFLGRPHRKVFCRE